MQGTIWETNFGIFLLVTVFLAGGAGYMSGRSVASSWRPAAYVFVYSAALACAARFFHYALFHGTLLSPHFWIVDFVIILAIAALGFRLTRTSQMVSQYSWLYERSSPLSWRAKPQSGGPAWS
jgi:hypothetical protein